MQKDYIMRMIEQAMAGLIAIVLKAETGQFQQACQDFDQACRNTVGLDLESVKKLSPDALADLLKMSGSLRFTRSIVLAEILLHEAEVLERRQENFPLANFVHAFCLIADSVGALSHENEALYKGKLKKLALRLEPFQGLPQLSERFRKFRSPPEK